MMNLPFPPPLFQTKTENSKRYIFDGIRKMWLLLTEEEWVRQNFVNYITVVLNYPSSFIALEKEIKLNDLKKRFDILIYNKQHQPWMLVECKEPKVALSEDVLQQVLRYNITVPVEFIIITNGENTIAWQKQGSELKMLEVMPEWS